MSNHQGWRDFRAFTGLLSQVESALQQVHNAIVSLDSEKVAIIDDADRLAEIKEIIDIHPDFELSEITAKLAKFATIKAYLEDNGYV